VLDPNSPREQVLPPGVANRVHGAVRDPRGGVLVYGSSQCRAGDADAGPADYDGAVWRFTRDGMLDRDFGVDGVACVGRLPGDPQQETFQHLALDPRGRIVVVGGSGPAGIVMRLDANGAPDPTFGQGGARRVAIPLSSWERTMSFWAVVAEEERVVVAGANGGPFSQNTLGFVIALGASGALDATFNQGRVWFDTSATGYYALLRDGDGYLAAGSDRATGHGRVVRFALDGALAPDFGAAGVAVLPRPDAFVVQAMVPVEDGGVVLAGAIDPESSARTSFPSAVMVRLDERGAVDEAFMRGGSAIPLSWNIAYQFQTSLARQCDGRLVLSGLGPNQVRVARFTPDGELDATFNEGGVAFVPNPGPASRPISSVGSVIDPATGVISTFTQQTARGVGVWRLSP
jgi:uncharacterized delta-60 repeat protein